MTGLYSLPTNLKIACEEMASKQQITLVCSSESKSNRSEGN